MVGKVSMIVAVAVAAVLIAQQSGLAAPSSSSESNPQNNYYDILQEVATKPQLEDKALKKAEDMAVSGLDASSSSASDLATTAKRPDLDLASQIALNNPEFRLIGPNRNPVRMRDDMQTKLVVAMDNLKKDANELWQDVSKKLDNGWTQVSGKVEESWSDARVHLDKGVADVSDKIDKSWTDLKSMFEKVTSSAAAAVKKTPTIQEPSVN